MISDTRERDSISLEAHAAQASDHWRLRPTASYLSSSPHLSTYESWLRTYVSLLIEKRWARDHSEPAK